MIVKRNDSDSNIWLGVFIGTFGVQQFPIVVLVLFIVFQKGAGTDGPTRKSKTLLIVATLLSLFNSLPLNVWALILPDNCYFWLGSLVDLIHLLYFGSLLFFFLFIRNEYLRNMEECIWTTVSQVQIGHFRFQTILILWQWGLGVYGYLFFCCSFPILR